MRKTASQVEADIYTLVKTSALKSAVNGDVYRAGMRPLNSKKEDIVVSFMTGLPGQVEVGTVTLSVFVPDMDNNGMRVKNISRIKTLEGLCDTFANTFNAEYRMELGNTIQAFKAENIDQHFIDVKLKFKRFSL